MYTQKERILLLMTYGQEEANIFFKTFHHLVDMCQLEVHHTQLCRRYCVSHLSVSFVDYCYVYKMNYEQIVDLLNTLRAIQRQVETEV